MTEAFQEYRWGDFLISTDPRRLQLDIIYGFLSRSYWAKDRSREAVARSIEHSLCFGVYYRDTQVGFARVITDYVVVANLVDVFIIEDYQGSGLGKWLLSCVVSHPELQDVRNWLLATRDAHSLYEKFGFKPLARSEAFMEARQPHPPSADSDQEFTQD